MAERLPLPLSLRLVLGLNVVGTAAAAIVLAAWPALIPGIAGVPFDPSARFVTWLLAAAEAGFAVLALTALGGERGAVRAAVLALATMHVASIAACVAFLAAGGESRVLAANAVARVVIVVGLVVPWRKASR